MASPILREKLDKGEFIFAPGIQDMITAVVANKVGFEVVYGTGYWLTASAYGIADAGIVSYTQMVDRMRTLVKTSNAAVMADADTGFGGLLNVHHTVRGYEEAGVSAIQIEDQEFPKKCGHTPNRKVVPCADMVEKIKVAVDARTDRNMLIIARTDARQAEGLDAAIARAQAYYEAGADVLFVEALETKEEMRRACKEVGGPMFANMSNGGFTPILTVEEMKEVGYAIAIAPSLTSLAAANAVEKSLIAMKEQGSAEPEGVPINDFSEFCSLIGFEDVWAFEKKWAK
ncbi:MULTISPECIES: isocitrate lyase/PEP mutase family protein [Alteromonadaceae]|uniref:isocitrate lyase/PEP mutase family protein n=1 Tax=Alteromonadaceae TaxID=72275 RepID=UPI001C08E98B|nr:isocitrate lyase/PEP mutase family protein [Aliiglaciecola lipolytica]MBU2879052.1 isocitrate lyase/PEP mutase family protein [Aliiglaciecola lipolytica]